MKCYKCAWCSLETHERNGAAKTVLNCDIFLCDTSEAWNDCRGKDFLSIPERPPEQNKDRT